MKKQRNNDGTTIENYWKLLENYRKTKETPQKNYRKLRKHDGNSMETILKLYWNNTATLRKHIRKTKGTNIKQLRKKNDGTKQLTETNEKPL